MICDPCFKTHSAHPPTAALGEQSLAAGSFSPLPGHLRWAAKGSTKSGPQKGNSREGILEEREGKMLARSLETLIISSFSITIFHLLITGSPAFFVFLLHHSISALSSVLLTFCLIVFLSVCVFLCFSSILMTAKLGAQRD